MADTMESTSQASFPRTTWTSGPARSRFSCRTEMQQSEPEPGRDLVLVLARMWSLGFRIFWPTSCSLKFRLKLSWTDQVIGHIYWWFIKGTVIVIRANHRRRMKHWTYSNINKNQTEWNVIKQIKRWIKRWIFLFIVNEFNCIQYFYSKYYITDAVFWIF